MCSVDRALALRESDGLERGRSSEHGLALRVVDARRRALSFCLTFLLAGCGNSDGDGETNTFSFRLGTDMSCYGASVHVDLSALGSDAVTDGELPCRLSTDLPPECFSDFTRDASALDLAVRGCFVPNDATIADCDLAIGSADRVTAAATIACGCGCQQTCPTAPSVCAYLSSGATCSPALNSFPPTNRAGTQRTSSTEVVAASTTSTTFCGTCCDVISDASIAIGDSEPLMELSVATAGAIGFQTGCNNDVNCTDASGTSGPGLARILGDEVEVCVSSPVEFTGPVDLAQCSVMFAGVNPGPGRVIRALDRNYRPLAISPTVSVDYY